MSGASSAAPGPDGARHRGVALYDPDNGHIAHIQRVTCFAGAPDLTPEQVAERARIHAQHAGHDVSRLKVTQLAPDHDYGVSHVVDTRTGTVIEAPRPPGSASPSRRSDPRNID
jgi:hypothetical protein